MKAKQDNKRRRAVAALASISAALAATALAIYTQANPAAFTTAVTTETDGAATLPPAIRPSARVLPRVEGRAVTNRASGPRTVDPRQSHTLAPQGRRGPSCAPYWRELESGPVGRHVLVTCPGARNPPAPPEGHWGARNEEQLRSLGTLAGSIPAQRLPGSFLPSGDRARLAAQQVDSDLRRRWQKATPASGIDEVGIPVLPLTNPLPWEPVSAQGS